MAADDVRAARDQAILYPSQDLALEFSVEISKSEIPAED